MNVRLASGVWREDPGHLARELGESEGLFQAMTEQSIAAIYVIENNRIVYVNRRMREIFGYAPGEPFDPNPLAHVKESEWPKALEQMQRRIKDEGEAAYSITALRKDRSEFTFGIHATRAIFKGKPAIVAIAQDISDKVKHEEETRRYVEGLERAMQGTIEAISVISEMRDPYTHGHERHVGLLAAAIASEMGLDAARVEGIRVAGYMHDVGKIGLPAEILSKPTRLTPAEFELVKCHAEHGYQVLKGIDFPWPVALVARQHHERLDGSGYPHGLKGDAIILEARITSVADVVEAMASHRPYRAGLGIERALEEIERGAGTVYDPVASHACLRLFRQRGFEIPV